MVTLEHVGICSQDTRKLKDWYITLFSFRIVYDNQKEMPTYFLAMEDNNMLEIYPAETDTKTTDNKHQGIRHLAFGTDQIEEAYQNLLDHQVEIIEPLKANDKGVKTVFFRDLEGNIIHFIQRPESLV